MCKHTHTQEDWKERQIERMREGERRERKREKREGKEKRGEERDRNRESKSGREQKRVRVGKIDD